MNLSRQNIAHGLSVFSLTALFPLIARQLSTHIGACLDQYSLIFGCFLLVIAAIAGLAQKKINLDEQQQHLIFIFALFVINLMLLNTSIYYIFYTILRGINSNLFKVVAFLLVLMPLIGALAHTLILDFKNKLVLTMVAAIFAAIVVPLFFMRLLGVSYSFFIIASMMVLANILNFPRKIAYLAVMLLPFFYYNTVYFDKVHKVKSNHLSTYYIVEKSRSEDGSIGKSLIINNGYQSFVSDNNKRGFAYIEVIKKILFYDLKLTKKNILVLGGGGFSLSTRTHNNFFTYVDIDSDLKQEVEKSFQKNVNGKVVINDARSYLHDTDKKHDVIVVDVYDSTIHIPEHLVTKEFFSLVKARTKENGYVILNVVANPCFDDKYSATLNNTIHAVFNKCAALPLSYRTRGTNIIYVCKNNADNLEDIYVDNKNVSMLDYN
jgi:spermidine synthase